MSTQFTNAMSNDRYFNQLWCLMLSINWLARVVCQQKQLMIIITRLRAHCRFPLPSILLIHNIIFLICMILDLLEYTDTFVEWDPLLLGCGPSNPWMSDDTTYWEINKPMWVKYLTILTFQEAFPTQLPSLFQCLNIHIYTCTLYFAKCQTCMALAGFS